jgi:hypothetical protein
VYGENMEIRAIIGVYNVSVSICTVSDGQFAQLPADVLVVEVVTERKLSILDNGKRD